MTKFSPQQQAVVDFVRDGSGSAFVEAVAGAGKTTTLIGALAETRGSVAFTAYNTKIANEIKGKVEKLGLPGNRVRVGTFHSFGFGAWRRIHPDVKSGPEAAREKAKMTVSKMVEAGCNPAITDFALKLISLGKQRAIGLIGNIADESLWYDIVDHFDLAYEIEDEELIKMGVEFAIRGLRYQIALAPKIIDFDDMIYMPVQSGCRMWENDFVFVDEAQDTNPARRALTRKMLRRGGRALFVGDRHQAIYGFTGADSDAIDQIIRDFNCMTLPLTTTYRCPKAVVEMAQTVVSHIQAAETAPQGLVGSLEYVDLPKIGLTASDAILCRNTKPLVETAYLLIRAGIACHVEGKDIGLGLLSLANRYAAKTLDGLMTKLDAYAEKECEKLVAKGKETAAEALQDRIETLKVIAEGCQTAADLRSKIAALFVDGDNEQKPTLTLSTVHKSKGREWNRVYLLGRDRYMPSKFARQDWQVEQEMNLIYVAYTRSQGELHMVNMPAPAK